MRVMRRVRLEGGKEGKIGGEGGGGEEGWGGGLFEPVYLETE